MYVEQLYTNCLAEAAYYIEAENANGEREAAIVDPIRDVEHYLELAQERNATITYVFETHFHADFVSGHLDLAAATGATIVYGPTAEPAYSVHVARDEERFAIGAATLEVLHTPGHTPESSCFLLRDESGEMKAIFTGDTLFVGDVGRPDLLDGKMSKEELASMMYDSMQRLRALPDDLTVYPAHGPGSACGKNIGKETWSTLGIQKRVNYALQPMSREEFIHALTTGLAMPPQYYFDDARINKVGYRPLSEVMSSVVKGLPLEEFESLAQSSDHPGAIVIDTREPAEFEIAHMPGSVCIGLSGTYAWWVGILFPIDTPILVIAPAGEEEQSIRRLARIGYENILGYLEGGFEAWRNAGRNIESVSSIEPEAFDRTVEGKVILDVRNPSEFETGHIEGAVNIPLADLPTALDTVLSPDTSFVVHCAAGYRSMIAVSLMERAGFRHVTNVHGGFKALEPVSLLVHSETETAS